MQECLAADNTEMVSGRRGRWGLRCFRWQALVASAKMPTKRLSIKKREFRCSLDVTYSRQKIFLDRVWKFFSFQMYSCKCGCIATCINKKHSHQNGDVKTLQVFQMIPTVNHPSFPLIQQTTNSNELYNTNTYEYKT